MLTTFLRINLVILTILLFVSRAPKKSIKEETALPSPPPAVAEMQKKPETPVQRPPEIKPLKKDEPIRVEQDVKDKYVVLNFDGADLGTVISAIGEMLNVNYILAPNVAGKVTIHSHKKISANDLLDNT
jgi:hypothetical protein